MLLCDRKEKAEQLLDVLAGAPQNFTIAAEDAEKWSRWLHSDGSD
ncbi:hypothetical protein CBM2586_A50471 [Cupriavidus phytorum]|uniref:Uncharacterized protein n=2 Tax=Cupriavidus TaxID=106589 RepID=A0A975X8K3_9BURK|nr:hypothetical protein CBM2586_A50471 [Cupriavidus taiwanensis]